VKDVALQQARRDLFLARLPDDYRQEPENQP
jgi:hypothetical protein